jgi:predicted dienelactone hydrolase
MHIRLLAILAILLFVLHMFALKAERPDAPPYARRGPYPVGTREVVIPDSVRPLNVTIWYPALNPNNAKRRATYTSGMLLRAEGQALRDAPPNTAGGPYPLIIFSHASGGFRFQSVFYTEHLASYGFVVMAADHPGNTLLDRTARPAQFLADLAPSYVYRPQDVLRQIDYAAQLTVPGGALAGLIDMNRVAVTGHSFGGYTALAAGGGRLDFDTLSDWCNASRSTHPDKPDFTYDVCFLDHQEEVVARLRGFSTPPKGAWAATSDGRIKAIVALAPWNGPILNADAISVPTMIMVGSTDSVTPPERDAQRIYSGIKSTPKALVTFANADHYVFVDACSQLALSFGFFSQCSDSVWDMERIHDLINHFATAFLLAVLKDDDSAKQALYTSTVDFRAVSYTADGYAK